MAKVLVVEDDVDIRGLVETRLRRHGHRVVSVGSGEEALTAITEKGTPDVAVLDVLMPGMDGLELLRTIRQDPASAGMQAVFLSGRIQESDIEAGRALGATYLTKPLVLSALVNAVDAAADATPAVVAATW